MSQRCDLLLKKLKSTKTLIITSADVQALANLAISLGPEDFAERWKTVTSAVPKKQKAATVSGGKLSALKMEVSKFGASRQLTSSQTAAALSTFARTEHPALPKPTKTALKGIPAVVDWLSKALGEEPVEMLTHKFVRTLGDATDTTHHLPDEDR